MEGSMDPGIPLHDRDYRTAKARVVTLHLQFPYSLWHISLYPVLYHDICMQAGNHLCYPRSPIPIRCNIGLHLVLGLHYRRSVSALAALQRLWDPEGH